MEKLRVLIADDHHEMRSYIVGLLASDFQIVGAVCDGEQLVESAACLLPDVIVSDVSMPRMDGFTARLELIARHAPIPFVFVSARGPETFERIPKDAPVALVYKGDMASCLKTAVEAAIAQKPYRSPLYS